jgi:hypothetical protein
MAEIYRQTGILPTAEDRMPSSGCGKGRKAISNR